MRISCIIDENMLDVNDFLVAVLVNFKIRTSQSLIRIECGLNFAEFLFMVFVA